jgi:hypothetical protein
MANQLSPENQAIRDKFAALPPEAREGFLEALGIGMEADRITENGAMTPATERALVSRMEGAGRRMMRGLIGH